MRLNSDDNYSWVEDGAMVASFTAPHDSGMVYLGIAKVGDGYLLHINTPDGNAQWSASNMQLAVDRFSQAVSAVMLGNGFFDIAQ